MTADNSTDDETRRAALKLLSTGLASPSDVAELAGVSRQVVAYWIATAGLDWRTRYRSIRARAWRKALKP